VQPSRRNRRGQIILGDIIVAVEGERIRLRGDLDLALEDFREDETVTLTVVRDGMPVDLEVRLDPPR